MEAAGAAERARDGEVRSDRLYPTDVRLWKWKRQQRRSTGANCRAMARWREDGDGTDARGGGVAGGRRLGEPQLFPRWGGGGVDTIGRSACFGGVAGISRAPVEQHRLPRLVHEQPY